MVSTSQWSTPLAPSSPISHESIDLTKDLLHRARMQVASRQLQDELSSASPSQFDTMFQALLPRTPELMMDGFGHYISEKLASMGSSEQKLQLLRSLQNRIC